jgi:hypothetical protein
MKKIYIAGKITGNINYKVDFCKAELLIMEHKRDVKICNPGNVRPFLGIESWFCYMIVAIKNVIWANDLYFLSNWKQLKGAKIERVIGHLLFKKIYVINDKPIITGRTRVVERFGIYYVYNRSRNVVYLKKIVPVFEKIG